MIWVNFTQKTFGRLEGLIQETIDFDFDWMHLTAYVIRICTKNWVTKNWVCRGQRVYFVFVKSDNLETQAFICDMYLTKNGSLAKGFRTKQAFPLVSSSSMNWDL